VSNLVRALVARATIPQLFMPRDVTPAVLALSNDFLQARVAVGAVALWVFHIDFRPASLALIAHNVRLTTQLTCGRRPSEL
jgi:hypothetical protein